MCGLPLTFSNALSFIKAFHSLAEFVCCFAVLLHSSCSFSTLAHSHLHFISFHSIPFKHITYATLNELLFPSATTQPHNIALMNLQMSIHLHLGKNSFHFIILESATTAAQTSDFAKVDAATRSSLRMTLPNEKFPLCGARFLGNFFFPPIVTL